MATKQITIGEFVRRATPLVAEQYGIRLDEAETLVRKVIQDEREKEKKKRNPAHKLGC